MFKLNGAGACQGCGGLSQPGEQVQQTPLPWAASGHHLVHLRDIPAKRCAHDTNCTELEPSEHPSTWKWTDELQDDFVILGISHSRESTRTPATHVAMDKLANKSPKWSADFLQQPQNWFKQVKWISTSFRKPQIHGTPLKQSLACCLFQYAGLLGHSHVHCFMDSPWRISWHGRWLEFLEQKSCDPWSRKYLPPWPL